jgi:biopolymer transport protein ExbD
MALGKLPDDDAGAGEGAIFADINITPLTDIFLVLLIIFMVTSSVEVDTVKQHGVKVNLPKGATKDVDTGAKSLVVSIMKSNETFIEGRAIKEGELISVFTSAVGRDPATQVIIEADEGVAHGTVVHIMELAKNSGIVRLAIATRGGGGGGP